MTPATPGPLLAGAVVLGGAADPWPVDGCGCATCRSGPGRPAGLALGRTLVLDGGDPAPDGVVHLATGGVAGVPATARTLQVGDQVASGPLRVVALPGPGRPDGGDAVAVVVSDGTSTVLWAPGRGPLPDDTLGALAGAGLDLVVVDVRAADGTASATHAAHRLADLRRAGALTDDTRVLAVGHDHRGPAPARSAADLALHGVRSAAGGERPSSLPPVSRAVLPRRTVVLGPASSGKSAVAEHLLAAAPHVDYAATGPEPDGDDADWATKVAAHRARRPRGWTTVEASAPGAVAALLASPGPPVLLDSLGTWVAAVLDRAGAWQDGADWRGPVEEEVAALVDAWRGTARDVVAVGDEVGWGVVPATRAGRLFAEVLGTVNRRLADASERTLLVVAGRTVDLDLLAAGTAVAGTATPTDRSTGPTPWGDHR